MYALLSLIRNRDWSTFHPNNSRMILVSRGLIMSTIVISVYSISSQGHSENSNYEQHNHGRINTNKRLAQFGSWRQKISDLSDIRNKGGRHIFGTIRKESEIKISQSLKHFTQSIPQVPLFTDAFNSVVHCSHPQDNGEGAVLTSSKKRRQNNSGFYYGIRDDIFFPMKEDEDKTKSDFKPNGSISNGPSDRVIFPPNQRGKKETPSSKTLVDIMGETLLELREMREDIYALREEMQYMKEELRRQKELSSRDYGTQIQTEAPVTEEEYEYPIHDESKHHKKSLIERVARQTEFERIGHAVEKWAHKLLFEEGEEHGWKEVKCHKMVRKKFNDRGQTTCYLKWMKDSREKHAKFNDDDDIEYPCIKVFTTIDAQIEDVCDYLSQEKHMSEYNDLVVAHRDLENISPHGKICWSQCPQILFIKPRDFVTYCHHRWRRDGTQIVVSQACEHEDAPGYADDSDDQVCRAYSLRGANFISRDPTDPNKTRVAILAHANPGGEIPQWAMKTAVNAVAPIEPFKLFYKINERVQHFVSQSSTKTPMTSIVQPLNGRSQRPAGLSQLGYACFWPDGGGRIGQSDSSSQPGEGSSETNGQNL